mmetsp:Transcript_42569/g.68548  ORF Transcript_42569/g.68548 Transcript_42569/m.68548 type:complete len:1271 (+) Transcript_42569:434-4246(+)|eukprot:CAMPEP_0203745582 /NCGR_PEP_ID=MMETSP0098-20131031/1266_1 /ASSEMBLY_ACC=CAM_ASM_000208 /TAXON_ID=96639 /ORGANISM=" , Strain NY0313808BC1" /LENGTH=1270 /DNA_ID=CAMNT_0050633395 /DNA_START=349 /DNA_END=4161 /DNA_ORIENTATION=+
MPYSRGRSTRSSEEAARYWANVLFWTLLGLGLVAVSYLVSVFLARPYYFSMCSLVCVGLWHYLAHPDSVWHKSQHLENQFWMLMTFTITCVCMFAPDSPYRAEAWETVGPVLGRLFGWIFVLSCTTAAHFIDKQHHRSRLVETPLLRSFTTHEVANLTADEKLERLHFLLGKLDRTLPSTLTKMWNITSILKVEREILTIFNDCSREELNYVILRMEMKLLAYKIKNHNKPTRSSIDLAEFNNAGSYRRENRSRSDLLDIFGVRRTSDLHLGARAIILDVISCLQMSRNPDTAEESQNWIMNILTTLKGDDLSDLKQLIDSKGSAESMHKLVYEDVKDEVIRTKILDHFKRQASTQAAQMAMGSSLARKRLSKGAWRKVLSDVDDTLFSSGGRYPAGMDTTYARKVFYPGVTALYKELNLGATGLDAKRGYWDPNRGGDLVFLSARPHVYKDYTEKGMFQKFAKFMKNNNLHSMPSLLPGDLESGQKFMMKGDFLPMAEKKFRNFAQYYSIYPEFVHVFIGDNGQADVKAAEFMIEKFGTDVVQRVYVHEVQPKRFTFGYEPGVSEQKWKEYGIIFCKTYVAAAVDALACERPLITIEGLRRITQASRDDFFAIKKTWKNPYEKDLRRMELNNDIALANVELDKAGLQSVPLIPGDCEYPIGTEVYTVFGRGFVKAYRPLDGIYEIVLDWKTPSGDPPRIYTVLHSMFTTQQSLQETQSKLVKEYGNDGEEQREQPQEKPHENTTEDIISEPIDIDITESPDAGEIEPNKTPPPLTMIRQVSQSSFPAGFYAPVTLFPGSTKVHHVRVRKKPSEDTASLSGLVADSNRSLASLDEFQSDESYQGPDILDIGTRVKTPVGPGVVMRFRESDDIYEIAIPSFSATAFIPEVSLITYNAKLFQDYAHAMVREGSYPTRLFGLMKTLFQSNNRTIMVHLPHSIVKTPYGQATVESYRIKDKFYKVRMIWGATAYIHEQDITPDTHHKELDAEDVEGMIEKDQSPLQKAKAFVANSRVMSLITLPFSVMGGNASSLSPEARLTTSDSLLSLASLVSTTSSQGSYFSTTEEPMLIQQVWDLKPGDPIDTAGFGAGTLIEIRNDGFFVISLPYGTAYINVPRLIREQTIIEPHSRVVTEFGVGIVQYYREEDQVYCIKMERWNALIYVCATANKTKQAPASNAVVLTTDNIQDKPKDEGKSITTSILSFITNIMGSSSKTILPETQVFPHQEFEISQRELTEEELRHAPGHTNFSWTASQVGACPLTHTAFSWDTTV